MLSIYRSEKVCKNMPALTQRQSHQPENIWPPLARRLARKPSIFHGPVRQGVMLTYRTLEQGSATE